MNHNYRNVIASLLFPFLVSSILSAQSRDIQFLQCTNDPISLCVQDEGIRLPANNQIFLGEENPDATSCSVHVTQKKLVQSTCDGPLQYEVQLFLNDTSAAYILKPLTSITPDSDGIAELIFDTELSPDSWISTSGIPYTSGCMRYHRIKWIVTDTCGAETTCEQLIDLYDCKQPLVSNDSNDVSVITLSIAGFAHIYAKDLIYGVMDDCTISDNFLISLEENVYRPDSFLYCCVVPAFGVEILYNVWLADDGRDLDCNGTIDWSERSIYSQQIIVVFMDNASCCEPGGEDVSGYVRNKLQHGIENVRISLARPGDVYPTFITEASGEYSYNGLYSSSVPYSITAEMNDNYKNGVSTLDLVKIQKHLLGKESFESPYQSIAADANNSQNVSAIDLVEIRKLILGIYTEFPSNKSWRFVRANFVFLDTIDPWYPMPNGDPEKITFTDPMNPGNLDFIGIKIGDVNNSAQPHFTEIIPREALKPFGLLAYQREYHEGEIMEIPILVSSNQSLEGLQLTLIAADMEILDVVPGRMDVAEGDYALFGDKMTISWFDVNNIDVAAGDILFTLVVRSNQAGHLSQALNINSDITKAEIYFESDQTFLPVLNITNRDAENELEIVSVSPNPWTNKTSIRFYLPQSDQVTYHVVDVNGRIIYSKSEYLKEGYQSIDLQAKDFPDRGLLFMEINAGAKSIIKRMMVMD